MTSDQRTGTGVVNPSTAVGRGDAELQVIGDTDVANGMYL